MIRTSEQSFSAARRRRHRGFTLIELLVVIAIFVVFLTLLLPYLWWAKEEANRSTCESNQGQLVRAAIQFSVDHQGNLVSGGTNTTNDWVNIGNLPSAITSGSLFAYVNGGRDISGVPAATIDSSPPKNIKLYLCPSDWIVKNIRTYSVNGFMRGSTGWTTWVGRLSQVSRPANTFYFIDEYDYRNYNCGSFEEWSIYDTNSGHQNEWVDIPGLFHLDGNNTSFVDGHVEWWQWSDPRTMKLVPGVAYQTTAGDIDLMRVRKIRGDTHYP